jgi:hypothetical protein
VGEEEPLAAGGRSKISREFRESTRIVSLFSFQLSASEGEHLIGSDGSPGCSKFTFLICIIRVDSRPALPFDLLRSAKVSGKTLHS